MRTRSRITAALLAGFASWVLPATAWAGSDPTYAFNFPAEDLGTALRAVAARAGLELYAQSRDVDAVPAQALHGQLTVRDAIAHLLKGSGLRARFTDNAILINPRATPDTSIATPPPATDIVVTGTHIRGATVIAPVVTVSAADMQAAGQTDLGEALRAVPQNFAGGQNPGVGWGISDANQNLNSSSSIDLRGLGPDATLTLLNGHRMPYDGALSGVDVSAIPAAAVDHIDIVMDGASALYGSDAVGGVVNVVLKRDVDGVTTSTQIGTATDGGDFNQQADIVAGTHWSGGGAYVAYDFAHNSAIMAAQRDYASSMGPGSVLYPSMTRDAVLVSGHQDITPDVAFRIDGTFDQRWSRFGIGSETTSGLSSYTSRPTVHSFAISPAVDVRLDEGWLVKIFGSVGQDISHYNSTDIAAGTQSAYTGCYCDTAYAAEIDADGPLFRLPGGTAHLAGGIGWRDNRQNYSYFTDGMATEHYTLGQHSFYAFGEMSLPLISPDNNVSGIRNLTLSAAGRFEDYPGMASVGTPKIGLLYEPDRSLAFKVSWGRSFKAPTLYQLGLPDQSVLIPSYYYGIGSDSQALMLVSGGNLDLKPETASSLTAGITFTPVFAPGLKIEATGFDIHYHNRILAVLTSTSEGISNPAYASLLQYNPSAATVNALLSASSAGIFNYTGAPVDPAAVAVIEDDRYLNVASQLVRGIDIAIEYHARLNGGGALDAHLSGTFLDSTERLTAASPETALTGTIFNPPKVRFRAGLTYSREETSLSGFINFTGALRDNLYAPYVNVPANATVDLDGRLPLFRRSDGRPEVIISLIVNNLFNVKPVRITPSDPTETPYDSTNYSPIGRMVGFGLTRSW